MGQLVKKISRATVFGDKADVQELVLKNRNAETIPLYSVGGICTKIDTIRSKFKPEDDVEENEEREERKDFKFIGDFVAINAQTGEVFESPVCYLPAFAANMIAGKMRPGDVFEFAFMIGVKFVEASATSYEFTITPMMDMGESEARKRIGALLAKNVKAIAAPKPE